MRKTIILLTTVFCLTITVYSQLIMVDGSGLYIEPETTLHISENIESTNATIWNYGTIDLQGHIENNLSALINSSSTGIFKFNGTSAQEITGDHDIIFHGITEIDNLQGLYLTSTMTGSDQTIHGGLTFTNGKLVLNEFNLFLGAIDPFGFTEDKYIQTNNSGMLKRNVPADGISYVNFPVGNASYNPLILRNGSTGETDIYGIRVVDEEPESSATPYLVDRSWVVNEDLVEGSVLAVIPQWNGGEELSAFNRSYCAVARFNNSNSDYDWAEFGAAMGEDPYYREGSEFTEVGTFTVGSRSNLPPVAVCQDISIEVDENCEAYITVEDVDDGSYDPNDDPITLSLDNYGPFGLGETTVTLTVTNSWGKSDQCSATVTVVDNTPPDLVIISDPITLWPPNHKYETIDINDLVLSVSDNCAMLSIADVNIVQVTSDEIENIEGDDDFDCGEGDVGVNDGNTYNDMVISEDCKSVQLRRERQCPGNGRVYTLYLELNDVYGNVTSSSQQVYVPIAINEITINDGPVYEVMGYCGDRSIMLVNNDENLNRIKVLVYPNPFSSTTNIEYELDQEKKVSLNIYNRFGQIVFHTQENQPQGKQQLLWNAENFATGLYYYRLKVGDQVVTGKLIKAPM